MVGARGIETLSVTFTAGVIAGTMVSGGNNVLPCILLPLIALPAFLQEKIARLPGAQSLAVLATTFLLLGMFCAWNAMQPGADIHWWVQDWADAAVGKLRAHIDALPFRNPDTPALLKALLTGDRSGLSRETVAVFRASGASHILALSGLHIGIIYLIFDKLTHLLGRTPAMRRLRFGLIVSGAGFFTLMTGAGPSIVRAFLFIVINETLRLLGRPRKAVRVLCLALLIQLVLNPASVREVGFQLSYLAMAGIFLLYPLLEAWYPVSASWDPFRKIWSMAALSISCQLFTGPLAWLRFHSFPRYFLLTNLMAIPLTSVLMATAVTTVLLGLPGWSPTLLITATDGLCRLLVWVLEVLASM